MKTFSRIPTPIVIGLVLVLALGGYMLFRGETQTRTVTAHFSRAVQIYDNTQVRILGVPVGKVTAVVPEGDTVRVDMEYDAEYDVPADAQAVIITPTLTADRFIQLTPAYTGGAKLADRADIAVQDTGTPVELDRIYQSLADLTKALGPNGVNRNGTLDNVLGAGAKLLDGEGKKANATIVNMSRAVQTFADGSSELFGTVDALDQFAGALAANDQAVSRFMADLGQVSQQLAGEKDELNAALSNLAGVLGKVERFVKGNRALLTGDVHNLGEILKVVAGQKKALEAVLDVGPAAMGNLQIAFDPKSGTIGSRLNFQGNVQDMDNFLCMLVRYDQMPNADEACSLFKQLLTPFEQQLQLPISAPSQPGQQPQSGGGATEVRYGNAPSAKDLSELLGGTA